jgi:hypothetical protein
MNTMSMRMRPRRRGHAHVSLVPPEIEEEPRCEHGGSPTTEPILGWRGFQLRAPGFLVPATASVLAPMERNEAVCPGGCVVKSHHEQCPTAPCRAHTCGFYAFLKRETLWDKSYEDQDVIAEVYFWGRVLVYSHGVRAQYSYPKQLWVLHDKWKFAHKLEDKYGVPVYYGDPLEDLRGGPRINEDPQLGTIATKVVSALQQAKDDGYDGLMVKATDRTLPVADRLEWARKAVRLCKRSSMNLKIGPRKAQWDKLMQDAIDVANVMKKLLVGG